MSAGKDKHQFFLEEAKYLIGWFLGWSFHCPRYLQQWWGAHGPLNADEQQIPGTLIVAMLTKIWGELEFNNLWEEIKKIT